MLPLVKFPPKINTNGVNFYQWYQQIPTWVQQQYLAREFLCLTFAIHSTSSFHLNLIIVHISDNPRVFLFMSHNSSIFLSEATEDVLYLREVEKQIVDSTNILQFTLKHSSCPDWYLIGASLPFEFAFLKHILMRFSNTFSWKSINVINCCLITFISR